MGEVPPAAPHLPDAFVRFLPDRFRLPGQGAHQGPACFGGWQAAMPALIQSIDHLTEDVELKLAVRGVADPYRTGALIAGQPGNLPLGQTSFTGETVHFDIGIAALHEGTSVNGRRRSR